MTSETLEHALAEAVAKRLTDAAQLLAELAAAADSESLRNAERQVRALPGDLA